jgi:hypothetical protein
LLLFTLGIGIENGAIRGGEDEGMSHAVARQALGMLASSPIIRFNAGNNTLTFEGSCTAEEGQTALQLNHMDRHLPASITSGAIATQVDQSTSI